jgi:hypothetical protein
MTATSLERLRRANPVSEPDPGAAQSPPARAGLAFILADPAPRPRRPRQRRLSRRFVVVCALALTLAAGGALAATGGFGLWTSPNPETANYRVDPTVHVQSPNWPMVRCAPSGPGRFSCRRSQLGPRASRLTRGGRPYSSVDTIRAPSDVLYERRSMLAAAAKAAHSGRIRPARARQLRGDIAAVPDRFFAAMRALARFGSYGAGQINARGQELVPPVGVPEFLVCRPAGRALACRDLNGDPAAPVGSRVYSALATRDWRATRPRTTPSPPTGAYAFTSAEIRVLRDLAEAAGSTSSSSSSPPRRGQRASTR